MLSVCGHEEYMDGCQMCSSMKKSPVFREAMEKFQKIFNANKKLNSDFLKNFEVSPSDKANENDFIRPPEVVTEEEIFGHDSKFLEANSKMSRLKIPCVNLREALETPSGCGCGSAVRYSCTKYGECRIAFKLADGVPSCFTCNDYLAVS